MVGCSLVLISKSANTISTVYCYVVENIFDPFLKHFPSLLEQLDLMDILLVSGLLFFLTKMSKNRKPKSDVSPSWLFFPVPFLLTHQLMIIAGVLLIPSFI